MRRVALLTVLLSFSASADPVASWVPVESFAPEHRDGLAQFQKVYCTPSVADVRRPVFPDAEIVALHWPKKKPNCGKAVRPEEFDSINFLSKRPLETVAAWYSNQLKGFSRFDVDRGVIFVKGARSSFDWGRDYGTNPTILITPAKDLFKDAGYLTFIEFSHPAL